MYAINANAQGNFYVNSATVRTTGTATITLNNTKLTNNGALDATTATVLMKGNATATNASINGTGTTNLNHLTIDKTANGVNLNQNINVKGNLTLTSGGMQLLAGNVDFGTTGSLQTETETNRVSGTGGYLQIVHTLNAPSSVNPANLGAALTTASNLGITTIRRKHAIITATGSSIARSFDITPTNNTALDATLRFYYLDAELNGNDENAMVTWRSVNGSTNWVARTVATRNTTQNWLETNAIAAFSSWTAATLGALPVKLLAFTGYAKDNENVLEWTTASEQNNKGFEILISGDGIDFKTIGFVNGAGTTNSEQYYTFTHNFSKQATNQVNNNQSLVYYKLKQIDFDSHFEYSNAIVIKANTTTDIVKCYPNPTNTVIYINATNYTQAVRITDEMGRIVQTHTATPNTIDLSDFAAGMYIVRIGNNHFKIVKQ